MLSSPPMTTPDADPNPHSDAPAYDPLPQQEECRRAPARFGSVPDAEPNRLVWGA